MKLFRCLSIVLLAVLTCTSLDMPRFTVSNPSPEQEPWKLFVDRTNGYMLQYPSGMEVDTSLAPIRSVIYNNHLQLEMYYDHFLGTVSDTAIYMNYSNRFLENASHHTIEADKMITLQGTQARYMRWHRNKLARLENDKHYYLSVEIPRSKDEIATLLFKSDQPIAPSVEATILETFQFIEPTENTSIQARFERVPLHVSKETRKAYDRYFERSKELVWGLFHPEAPDSFEVLASLEKTIQHRFDFLVRYQSLDTGLPKEALNNAWRNGRLVELTLQTMHYGMDNSGITYQILNGEYDDYFHQYARDLKAFGHPVLFRLNNEMNGDWVVYSSWHSSKDTDLYKAVWKYIYGIFKQHGVDNVLWVWNPNHASLPGFAWNHELMYYPGDEYVDIVGLTAYNTGTYYPGETWRSFSELYDPLYERYTAWFDKPLMITEFASSSIGGDKARWISDMFEQLHRYPRLRAAIWWSHVDYDGDRESRIYRLDENPRVLEQFSEGLHRIQSSSLIQPQ
jgi:mannan endo-1,4-beta-mannosidase